MGHGRLILYLDLALLRTHSLPCERVALVEHGKGVFVLEVARRIKRPRPIVDLPGPVAPVAVSIKRLLCHNLDCLGLAKEVYSYRRLSSSGGFLIRKLRVLDVAHLNCFPVGCWLKEAIVVRVGLGPDQAKVRVPVHGSCGQAIGILHVVEHISDVALTCHIEL